MLRSHPKTLQKTVNGEGKDEDESLGFGRVCIDPVAMASSDNVILMARSMFSIGLDGEFLVMMVVAFVAMMMGASRLLFHRLGRWMSVRTMRMGQE